MFLFISKSSAGSSSCQSNKVCKSPSSPALESVGKGENYGVEFTLERYFAKNFYYLATASIFESKYQAKDGVWRKSRFAGDYNANFLVGKEWAVGEKKNNAFQLNLKTTLVGGQRYTPVDLEKSRAEGRHIWSDDPLSAKAEDIFFMNVSGVFRLNKKKTSHEFKLEVLNATNNQARVREFYNAETGNLAYTTQLAIIPNIMYTLNF